MPAFLVANVFIDIQPFLVLHGLLEGRLHGLTHTFLIGGLIGAISGIFSYLFLAAYIRLFRGGGDRPVAPTQLPNQRRNYPINLKKMVLSGVAGAWLHILMDSPLYRDITPFYPFTENPLYGYLNYTQMSQICLLFLPVVVVLYFRMVKRHL